MVQEAVEDCPGGGKTLHKTCNRSLRCCRILGSFNKRTSVVLSKFCSCKNLINSNESGHFSLSRHLRKNLSSSLPAVLRRAPNSMSRLSFPRAASYLEQYDS